MIYSSWQQAIFQHVKASSRNLMIIAFAGCAKTTSIVEAIKYTRPPAKKKTYSKYPEQNVMFMAFGKKIADELKNRVPKTACVRTCHSYGYAAIRYNWGNVVVDNDRNYRIAESVLGKDAPNLISMVRFVSLLKCDAITNESPDEDFYDVMDEFLCGPDLKSDEPKYIFSAREILKRTLVQDSCVSYDDMVYVAAILGLSAGRYEYIFVDETQDLNKCQLKLIRNARKAGTKFIFCGDPNQAIFGFRKADMNSIPNIIKEFNCEVLTLPVTYRCGKKIVQYNKKYVPGYMAHETNQEGEINDIPSRNELLDGVQVGDFVLSRKNAPLMKLCLTSLADGKPAVVAGKDIGAGLIEIIKKSKKKTMPSFIEWLKAWKENELEKHSEEDPKKKEKAEQKIENIKDKYDCIIALTEDVYSVDELIKKLQSLFADADDNLSTKIVYSSVHKAKGLEANRVWVLQSTLRESTQEEKNICYVAYTRAKNVLNIVHEKF